MNEERENNERPTHAEADTVQVSAERVHVSHGDAVGGGERADVRSASRPGRQTMTGQVNVKTTDDDVVLRDEVAKVLGTASSAPETYRAAVRYIAAALESASTAKVIDKALGAELARASVEREQKATRLGSPDLAVLATAVDRLTEATRERTRELNYIGHNFNMMTKLGLAGEVVDADALAGIERALDGIRDQMVKDAKRDLKFRGLL